MKTERIQIEIRYPTMVETAIVLRISVLPVLLRDKSLSVTLSSCFSELTITFSRFASHPYSEMRSYAKFSLRKCRWKCCGGQQRIAKKLGLRWKHSFSAAFFTSLCNPQLRGGGGKPWKSSCLLGILADPEDGSHVLAQ